MDSFSKKAIIIMVGMLLCSCATFLRSEPDQSQAIENPFTSYGNQGSWNEPPQQNITLRSKKGDRTFEVELPESKSSDLVVPMDPKFMNPNPRGEDGLDYQYTGHKPTTADREIAMNLSSKPDQDQALKQYQIEQNLGLQASDEPPAMEESYLAQVDMVKQLFKNGRYEASLIEIDRMIQLYPTDARLFEMRGTVLDRLGYQDLAVKSWKQSLEFNPKDVSLKKLVEKRQQDRNIASERSKK